MNPLDILKSLAAAQVQAEANLDGQVAARNAPAWEIAKRRAAEEVVALTVAYNSYVDESVALIFVNGPEAERFAEIAEEVGNTITISTMELYRTITQFAWESMGGTGQFGPSQMATVLSQLHQFAIATGIRGYRVPHLDRAILMHHKSHEETALVVKEALNVAEGDLFTAVWMRGGIHIKAVQQQRTDQIIPVVVLDATQIEKQSLVNQFGFKYAVEADAVETDELELKNNVVKTFTKLKAAVKTTKEN